jgi:hypothetical protein
MFHVPNLISIFRLVGRFSKESLQVRGSLELFVTTFFLRRGVVSPTPNPKLKDHPLSSFRRCLLNIFTVTNHFRMPSLHPQPENAPYCYPHLLLKYCNVFGRMLSLLGNRNLNTSMDTLTTRYCRVAWLPSNRGRMFPLIRSPLGIVGCYGNQQ